ncbi:MAG: hypothetical protein KKG00_12325 [Bacteroidetes bacterium]|nr:hypothetical protein [Bacteroidota bacterium]
MIGLIMPRKDYLFHAQRSGRYPLPLSPLIGKWPAFDRVRWQYMQMSNVLSPPMDAHWCKHSELPSP